MRTRYIAFAVAVIAPMLLGARDSGGGCQTTQMPTMRQVEVNIPSNIRRCPLAPKSPGASATHRQVANYIVRLRDAWAACNGNVRTMDRLYRQWQSAVSRANAGASARKKRQSSSWW